MLTWISFKKPKLFDENKYPVKFQLLTPSMFGDTLRYVDFKILIYFMEIKSSIGAEMTLPFKNPPITQKCKRYEGGGLLVDTIPVHCMEFFSACGELLGLWGGFL